MKERKNKIQGRAIISRLAHRMRILSVAASLLLILVSCTSVQQPRSAASREARVQTQPSRVDAAWHETTTENTKEAYIAFVRKHRDTHYTDQVMQRLEQYATSRQHYAVTAIRPQREKPRARYTKAKITKDHGGGRLDVVGVVEHSLNPTTGSLENLLWNPGAEHTILCMLLRGA